MAEIVVPDTTPRNIPEPSSSRCLPGSARIWKITLAGAPIRRDTVMGSYSLPAISASIVSVSPVGQPPSAAQLPGPAPTCSARALSRPVLIAETEPVAERVQVREIDDDEGQRPVRIVRRDSG